MVWKKLWLMLAVVGLIFNGCGSVIGTAEKPLSAKYCQEVIDQIKVMQPRVIPGNLAQAEGMNDEDDFNANAYFDVLKNISMEGGYVLDYAYFIGGPGGMPALYARAKSQKPYKNFTAFSNASETLTRPAGDVSIIYLVKEKNGVKYGNKVNVKNTNEGYFEYTLLQIMGPQFYLLGRANMYDIRIACEGSEVEKILADIDSADLTPIDDGFRGSARALDLNPVVEATSQNVTVKLVGFSMWGGFQRYSYTIAKEKPHSFLGFQKEVLLPYDCGKQP